MHNITCNRAKGRESQALRQIRKADSKLHVLTLAIKQKSEAVDLDDILSCIEAVQADILIAESALANRNQQNTVSTALFP